MRGRGVSKKTSLVRSGKKSSEPYKIPGLSSSRRKLRVTTGDWSRGGEKAEETSGNWGIFERSRYPRALHPGRVFNLESPDGGF